MYCVSYSVSASRLFAYQLSRLYISSSTPYLFPPIPSAQNWLLWSSHFNYFNPNLLGHWNHPSAFHLSVWPSHSIRCLSHICVFETPFEETINARQRVGQQELFILNPFHFFPCSRKPSLFISLLELSSSYPHIKIPSLHKTRQWIWGKLPLHLPSPLKTLKSTLPTPSRCPKNSTDKTSW